MPWELQLLNVGTTSTPPTTPTARWLRTKSGDIDQFATQLAFDPDAGLAVWMATNGAETAPKEVPGAITSMLFPTVAVALSRFQAWSAPKRYEDMIGVYTAYVASVSAVMTANISAVQTGAPATTVKCTFSWGGAGFGAILVARDADGGYDDIGSNVKDNGDTASVTVHVPKTAPVACMLETELGWDGERMDFDFGAGTMEVPAMLTVTFAKQKRF